MKQKETKLIKKKKRLIYQENINISKEMSFEEFYIIIPNEYTNIIEELKEQIARNNCILIQFDDSI